MYIQYTTVVHVKLTIHNYLTKFMAEIIIETEKSSPEFPRVSCALFLLRYVQPPVINFNAIYEQSTPSSPIVFILSPGSDPGSDLMKLAERSGFGDKFKFLAMGQGQEKVLMTFFFPYHSHEAFRL